MHKIKIYYSDIFQDVQEQELEHKTIRPVAYAILLFIEDELKRLESLGVVSFIDYSDWTTPIVAVRKLMEKEKFNYWGLFDRFTVKDFAIIYSTGRKIFATK